MPLADFPFQPGFFADQTDRVVGKANYWKDGDMVRFVNGLPEKLGGWRKNSAAAVIGVPRDLFDWASLRGEQLIAIGTSKKLYVWNGSTVFDITPIRSSGTLDNNPFTTTDTLATVAVAHTGHGVTQGSYVTFSGASAAGGITLSGEYTVTSVTDTNNYVITHSAAATSSTAGGGNAVAFAYQINIGADDSTAGLGWGAGPFGGSAWGTARSTTDIILNARVWGLDNWGEDLVACPRDGNIYIWDSSAGTSTRAAIASGAPTSNKWVRVSQQDRHLIAFGAGGDPLLVQWSDTEDYTTWAPSLTNTAGDKRLDQGTEIYSAYDVRDEKAIFTNYALYSMQFSGGAEVFTFRLLGANGGILGPNAAVEYAGRLFWMGRSNFYVYDGAISPLPCPVKEYVFRRLNFEQRYKVTAAAVNAFGEIWFFYVSSAATEIDSYVVYNTIDNCWSYGSLSRTVYIGDSDVFGTPYGMDASGNLYFHETGHDNDGAAITSYIASGDIELPATNDPDTSAGGTLMHISKLIPDFKRLEGEVTLTVSGKKYPQATATESAGAISATSTTPFINPRMRARQVSIRLDCNGVGDDWRLGVIRMDLTPHGGR
jgi:hypothetical protein